MSGVVKFWLLIVAGRVAWELSRFAIRVLVSTQQRHLLLAWGITAPLRAALPRQLHLNLVRDLATAFDNAAVRIDSADAVRAVVAARRQVAKERRSLVEEQHAQLLGWWRNLLAELERQGWKRCDSLGGAPTPTRRLMSPTGETIEWIGHPLNELGEFCCFVRVFRIDRWDQLLAAHGGAGITSALQELAESLESRFTASSRHHVYRLRQALALEPHQV